MQSFPYAASTFNMCFISTIGNYLKLGELGITVQGEHGTGDFFEGTGLSAEVCYYGQTVVNFSVFSENIDYYDCHILDH